MSKRRELEKVASDEEQLKMTLQWAWAEGVKGLKGGPVAVRLGRERRSLEQNAMLWACLTDVANQVEWYGEKLTKDEWKHVFSGSLEQQKAVPGIDGGVVFVGKSTSQMGKKKFTELLELILWFGATRGVTWSNQALSTFNEYITGERQQQLTDPSVVSEQYTEGSASA